MTTTHARTLAQALERLNAGDVEGYMLRLFASGCRFHGYPDDFSPDVAGITAFYQALVTGLPDARVEPQDLLVDGDRVAVRYVVTGTHAHALFGVPGTGRSLHIDGITVLHFRGDQVVERWNRMDDVSLFSQLGAVPALA